MGDSLISVRRHVRLNALYKFVSNMLPVMFTVVVLLILLVGWRLRSYELITPEHGAGLMLGIIGTVAMVILLIYPLRKRIRGFEPIGSVKMWFRVHMILGILGPVCILFHCNFQLGSLNSNVALFSMLIVSLSGVMGRYIYSRIHHGLYGQKAELVELKNDFDQSRVGSESSFSLIPGIYEVVDAFARDVLASHSTLLQSVLGLLLVRLKALGVLFRVKTMTSAYLSNQLTRRHWGSDRTKRMRKQMERKTWRMINKALKVSEFNFYERVFALWHMLHLPLVFILAFAIVVHVFAVNRY